LNDPNAIRHLQFFSDQFAKPTKGNNNLHKISSEYFNHVLNHSEEKVYGMLYPTVEYEYNDLNLALLPEAVDKFLSLNMVIKFELTITEGIGDLRPIEIPDIGSFEI